MSKDKKIKYWNCSKLLSEKCDVSIVLSSKGIGKSYSLKEFLFLEVLNEGKEFLFIRRFKRFISPSKINRYFGDVTMDFFNGILNKITDDNFKDFFSTWEDVKVKCYSGEIYLLVRQNGDWIKWITVGWTGCLDNEYDSYSSGQYPNVFYILFEEFERPPYAENELLHYYHVTSSIIRERNGRVFMLGNLDCSICPYFDEFGIKQLVDSLEQNEIKTTVYEAEDGNIITIAIERASNYGKRNFLVASDKYRKMIANGEWHTDVFNTGNPYGIVIYVVNMKFNNSSFKLQLKITPAGKRYLFIYPSFKTNDCNRIISNEIRPYDIRYDTRLDISNKYESIIKKMIDDEYSVFFATNEVGTSFYNNYRLYYKKGGVSDVI